MFIKMRTIYVWKLKVKMLVAQSCLTLCSPMDCSLPGSSVHGILQARILEWVAISFFRDQTQVSCIDRQILYHLKHQRRLQKIEGKRRRRQQWIRCLDSITDSMNMNRSKLWEVVRYREDWCAVAHGVRKSWTWLGNWKTTTLFT